MIKANATKTRAGTITIESVDVDAIAGYFAKAGDTDRRQREERKESATNNVAHYRDRVEYFNREIVDAENNRENAVHEVERIENELRELPPTREVSQAEVHADLQKALALPFIKSITTERDGSRLYIVATTRDGVLTTTLARKFSRAQKWYRAKPYKIALPAYKIRISTGIYRSITQNTDALALAFANPEQDTANYLQWINRYRHQPHPHWGTPSVRGEIDQWRGICLGEFELDVSRAVRTSITDALVAVSIYLQTAGSPRAYVQKREEWALWLGKKAYNFAIVPSEKEVATLTEAEDDSEQDDEDDDYCDCRHDEDDDCDNDNCVCPCHN